MLQAEQLNRNKCRIIQKWFAHFTSKQSAKIMMWPESHIWGLQLITVPPPTVYLMELRHVHIHRLPSKYLHMPSFKKKKKKFVVSLLLNNIRRLFSEQKCNFVERKTFRGFGFHGKFNVKLLRNARRPSKDLRPTAPSHHAKHLQMEQRSC